MPRNYAGMVQFLVAHGCHFCTVCLNEIELPGVIMGIEWFCL
jgi:hypothetical protein